MIVTPRPLYLDMRNARGEVSGTGRHSGIHLSAITDHLARAAGKNYRDPDAVMSEAETQQMAAYVEMGFIWECIVDLMFKPRMLGRRMSNLIVQLNGTNLDGIYGTPDALDITGRVNGVGGVGEEYKATWQSCRGWDEPGALMAKKWDWMVRIMGYAKMLNVLDYRLMVFFVNGYMTRPFRPRPMAWDLTFTQDEIDANWDMILAHKDSVRPEEWDKEVTHQDKVVAHAEEVAAHHAGDIEILFGAEFDHRLWRK